MQTALLNCLLRELHDKISFFISLSKLKKVFNIPALFTNVNITLKINLSSENLQQFRTVYNVKNTFKVCSSYPQRASIPFQVCLQCNKLFQHEMLKS